MFLRPKAEETQAAWLSQSVRNVISRRSRPEQWRAWMQLGTTPAHGPPSHSCRKKKKERKKWFVLFTLTCRSTLSIIVFLDVRTGFLVLVVLAGILRNFCSSQASLGPEWARVLRDAPTDCMSSLFWSSLARWAWQHALGPVNSSLSRFPLTVFLMWLILDSIPAKLRKQMKIDNK